MIDVLTKFLIELARIYKKTKSEVKKIFIYDFLITFYKIEELLDWFEIDVEKALLLNHFIHISQLLESSKLHFKEGLIKILEKNNIF